MGKVTFGCENQERFYGHRLELNDVYRYLQVVGTELFVGNSAFVT